MGDSTTQTGIESCFLLNKNRKWASQHTLIRLGSFDSSNVSFSPKKVQLVGIVGFFNFPLVRYYFSDYKKDKKNILEKIQKKDFEKT